MSQNRVISQSINIKTLGGAYLTWDDRGVDPLRKVKLTSSDFDAKGDQQFVFYDGPNSHIQSVGNDYMCLTKDGAYHGSFVGFKQCDYNNVDQKWHSAWGPPGAGYSNEYQQTFKALIRPSDAESLCLNSSLRLDYCPDKYYGGLTAWDIVGTNLTANVRNFGPTLAPTTTTTLAPTTTTLAPTTTTTLAPTTTTTLAPTTTTTLAPTRTTTLAPTTTTTLAPTTTTTLAPTTTTSLAPTRTTTLAPTTTTTLAPTTTTSLAPTRTTTLAPTTTTTLAPTTTTLAPFTSSVPEPSLEPTSEPTTSPAPTTTTSLVPTTTSSNLSTIIIVTVLIFLLISLLVLFYYVNYIM